MEILNKIEGFFTNNVKTFAIRNWKPYKVKKEWLAAILVILFIKLGTNAVSIFSGYQFLKNTFFSLLNSEGTATAFSIFTLVLIEALASLMLAKFFKFALRLDFRQCILPFCICFGVFWISCSISCRGIAIYSTQEADLSVEINGKYNTQLEVLKQDYAANCEIVKEHIASIKANPEQWKDGKRCVLSPVQNQQLNDCYNKLNELKQEYNTAAAAVKLEQQNEIAANDAHTVNEAEKYYKYVAVIMACQVVATGLLWFFWAWIAKEEAPEIDQKETIKRIYDKAEDLLSSGFNTCMDTKFSILSTAFALLNSDLQAKNAAAAAAMAAASEPPTAPKNQRPGIGFAAAPEIEAPPAKPLQQAPEEAAKRIVIKVGDVNEPPKIEAEAGQKTASGDKPHSDTYGPVVAAAEQPQKTAAASGYLGLTNCKYCGVEFQKRSWNNYYCCPEHKDKFWQEQGLDIGTIKKANAKR